MNSIINIPIFSMLVASATTFLMIYCLRPFAIKIGFVDVPSGRKMHDGHVPLIGGIAMYAGVIVSILLTSNSVNELSYFILASGIILTLGVIDDYTSISAIVRIGIQVLVAIFITTVCDINIESFGELLGGDNIVLNEWSYIISIFAIVAGINAVNMTDGIHGLAGGNSLITFLAIICLSINGSTQEITLILFLFCSVLPVFLANNVFINADKSRRIFMGDAGSMFIGVTIVWSLISLSQGEDRVFSPVIALWLFALPLVEIAYSIIRRLCKGASLIESDTNHIHHLLMKLGIDNKYILLMGLLFSIFTALIGILGELYGVDESKMFFGFLLIFVTYSILHIIVHRKILINTK